MLPYPFDQLATSLLRETIKPQNRAKASFQVHLVLIECDLCQLELSRTTLKILGFYAFLDRLHCSPKIDVFDDQTIKN